MVEAARAALKLAPEQPQGHAAVFLRPALEQTSGHAVDEDAHDQAQHLSLSPTEAAQNADLARLLRHRHEQRVGHDQPTDDDRQACHRHRDCVQHLEQLLLVRESGRDSDREIGEAPPEPPVHVVGVHELGHVGRDAINVRGDFIYR